MFEFSAQDLGLPIGSDQTWGFGEEDFTVNGWLRPGATFATGVEDPDKDWAIFFSKADPGPGRLQYGAFASLYSDDRIRFGVEDVVTHRLEVACSGSCVPRAECPDDPGDWGGTDARGVAMDPCVEALGLGFTSCCVVENRWTMFTFVRLQGGSQPTCTGIGDSTPNCAGAFAGSDMLASSCPEGCTYANHTLRIYVDGLLLGEKTVPPTDVSNLGMLRIGAHPVFQNGMNIDGFMDDIRLYDYALNASEIAILRDDTWGLHCYDIVPPENAMPGSCAVPTEFNPGGMLHEDNYLETGTWCNFACLIGYKLVGRRPYCNYGFNLGNATCEAVVLTDNCTDVRAENYYLRRPTCSIGSPPSPAPFVGCELDGLLACVPRESCTTPGNASCDMLVPFEYHAVRPEGVLAEPAKCTGSGFDPGPCVDYALDPCSSVGMIGCGGSCVLPGTVLSCAQIFEATGRCPTSLNPNNCVYHAEVLAVHPEDVWTEHTCEYVENGNFWRADECVDPASDFVNRTDKESCEHDASGFEWTDSPVLRDDGTCNYTCAVFADFGNEADLTQCMIYDHNPWVWNIASSGLVVVDSSRVFLMQGPSNIGEYEGRVNVYSGKLVARHVLLQHRTAPAGGALTIRGGDVAVESCKFIGNTAIYDGSADSGRGGAIFVSANAQAAIQQTAFVGNRATLAGGAIFVDTGCGGNFVDADFRDNAAGHNGGALAAVNATVAVSSSTFAVNSVGRTNGTHDRARRRLSHDEYHGYFGQGMGGAMFLHGSVSVAEDVVFYRNLATVAGGAVYTLQGQTILDQSVMRQNRVSPDCSFVPGDNSSCGIGCTYVEPVEEVIAVTYQTALPARCVDNDPTNPAGPYVGPTVPRQSCADWDLSICRYKVGCTYLPASAERFPVEGVEGVEEACLDTSNSTGLTAGGAIYAEEVLLVVDSGLLEDNFAGIAPELYVLDMPDGWKIKDTVLGSTFSPYDPIDTVVAVHAPPAGCQRHPCPFGHACEYANYSTWCPRCFHTLYSDDGVNCKRAVPGEGSAADGSIAESYPTEAPHQAESVPCDPTLVSHQGFCLPCPRGQQANSSGLCVDCRPGLFSNDGGPCRTCPPAKEPNDVFQAAGLERFTGRKASQVWTQRGGATDCLPCVSGTYSADGRKCLECPGSFYVNPSQTGCLPVPSCMVGAIEGTYTPDDGKTCLPCPDGTEVMTNTSGCDLCSGNQVSPLGVTCRSCLPGTQPNDATASWRNEWRRTKHTNSRTDCVSCEEVSRAAYSTDGIICLDCPLGKEPNWNRTACMNCSSDQLWLFGECRDCPSGTEPNPAGFPAPRHTCRDCLPGYAGVDGVCTLCEEGKEPTPDRTACDYCTPGTTSDETRLATLGFCPVCPVGRASEVNGEYDHYQSLLTPRHMLSQNRTKCIRCEAGKYSSDGVRCRVCNPGYQVNEPARNNCTACELGKYSPDGSDCVTCRPGQEMNAPLAATACLSCALRGTSYHSLHAIVCTQCIPGTTPNEDLSNCRPCPSRTAGPAGQCAVCASGKSPTTDRTSCRRCPFAHAGTFGECVLCPDGFQPNFERTGCVPCPPGLAGRFGRCNACGVGTMPIAWTNCSDPSFNDEAECLAAGGSCEDPRFTTREDCLMHGTCCIATVEEGIIQTSQCLPITGTEVSCQLPPVVASRGAWSRAATEWTRLRWTSLNEWTPHRSECAPCAPYEYGPDGASCVQCAAGYQTGSDRSTCDACTEGTEYSNAADGTVRLSLLHNFTGVFTGTSGSLDTVDVPDSCTSTLVPVATRDDTTLCALTRTPDFGITEGTCASLDETSTCNYVPGSYVATTPDTVDVPDGCRSTKVPTVTPVDSSNCFLTPSRNFGASNGTCSKTALNAPITCAYVPGRFSASGNLDTADVEDSCTSTMIMTGAESPADTVNCIRTPTPDFGVTFGSCADANSDVARCVYVPGSFSASGALDTVDIPDSCTSTTVEFPVERDTTNCILTSGDADFDASTQGSCVEVDSSFATCEYVDGVYSAQIPDVELTPDSCESTLVATITRTDTTNCDLTTTPDFGFTHGSCAPVTNVVHTADSCTSTLVATVAVADTIRCILNATEDFGATAGSCSAVDSNVAACVYIAGSYSDSDSDGALDMTDVPDSCTSTLVPIVTTNDLTNCVLDGTPDFGATAGTCSALDDSVASCVYTPGIYHAAATCEYMPGKFSASIGSPIPITLETLVRGDPDPGSRDAAIPARAPTQKVSFFLTASARPPVHVDMELHDAAGNTLPRQQFRQLCIPPDCVTPANPNVEMPLLDRHGFGPVMSSGEAGPFVINSAHPDESKISGVTLYVSPVGSSSSDECETWDRHCRAVFVAKLRQNPPHATTVELGAALWWGESEREAAHHLRGMACDKCLPGNQPNRPAIRSESPTNPPAWSCRSCTEWGPGFYSAVGVLCVTCPSGMQPTEDRTKCQPCPFTDYGVDGVCYPCRSGLRPTSDQRSCVPCPPGHVGYDGECMRCANGTSPDLPQLECTPCAPGYAGRLGFCDLCPQTPHATVPATASSRFIEHPLGPGSLERMDCTRCLDTYSDDGVTCKRCPWGWGVNEQENGCYICPFGTVSTGGVACVTCPPGFEVNAEIDYEYDTLKQTNGSTECRSCELRGRGYYSRDGVECFVCPAGSTPDLTLDCRFPGVNDWGSPYQGLDCPAGRDALSGWVPRSKCERCRDGTTNSGSPRELADKVCDICPDGQWSWASVTCEYCPENQAGLNGQCRDCPDGTMPDQFHTYCDACPAGRAGRNGYCHECYPGYVPDPLSYACETCAVAMGGDRCTCGSGITPAECKLKMNQADCEATGECFDCEGVGGAVISEAACSSSSQGQCSARVGKWSARWSVPDPDISEWYEHNNSCHRCTAGKEPNKNGTACVPCPPGTAGVDGTCRPCRDYPHMEVPNELSTDCIYSLVFSCSVMARAYADNKTAWLVQEMRDVNIAAKAYRIVPLVCVFGGTALVFFAIHKIQAWWEWNRVFKTIAPLRGQYEHPPMPNWVRFYLWLLGILKLIAEGNWRELLRKLRVCCCPAGRARPKPPPVFEVMEIPTRAAETETESDSEEDLTFAEKFEAEAQNTEIMLEDDHEAAEYTASFM